MIEGEGMRSIRKISSRMIVSSIVKRLVEDVVKEPAK